MAGDGGPQAVGAAVAGAHPREFERAADAPAVTRIDPRCSRGGTALELGDCAVEVVGDELLDLSPHLVRHVRRKVEVRERGAQVQTGAAGHDRHPAPREDIVDRRVRRSGKGSGGRGLGEAQVADEMVGHLPPFALVRAVSGDLEAAVALERVGDDDLAVECPGGGVRECALPRRGRPEQREDP